MRVIFHRNFHKQYEKLRKKDRERASERIALFIKDPFHPQLNNHPLKGRYADYRSINITGDLRAVYKYTGKDECIFVIINTHSNLYS